MTHWHCRCVFDLPFIYSSNEFRLDSTDGVVGCAPVDGRKRRHTIAHSISHLILLKLEMRASWTDDPNLHIRIFERSAGGRVTGARFPGRLSPLVVLVHFPRNWPIWYANFQVTERRSHQSWASAKIHAATRRWRWRTSVQLRLRHLHVDHRVRQPATRPIKDRLHAKDR